MLNAIKKPQGDDLEVILEGDIDQAVNFAEIVGPSPKRLVIDTANVRSINSVGVKSWISYFGGLRKAGIPLLFRRCSPMIVYQINIFSNFIQRQEVESLYAPFLCPACKTESLEFLDVKDSSAVFTVPTPNCPNCAKLMVFDDIEDEYFNFLVRTG